jgi:hypothetical protein
MVAERGYNRAAVAGQEPVSERWRLFDACSNAPTLRIYEWWKGTLSLSLSLSLARSLARSLGLRRLLYGCWCRMDMAASDDQE